MATQNIHAEPGTTARYTFTAVTGTPPVPVDLTGVTAAFTAGHPDERVLSVTDSTGITVDPAGTVTVTLTPAQTQRLHTCRYAVDLTFPSSDVVRLVEGLLSTRAPRQPTANDYSVLVEDRGPKGDPGTPGPAGPTGGGGGTAAEYVHTQTVASATWTITHNLGTNPDVLIVDATGEQLITELIFPNLNTVTAMFGSPYSGTAYLRG